MKLPQTCGALALAAALAAFGGDARAQKDEARETFQKGVELFKNGDYEEAAAAFEKAYELKPIYKLLFNVGQARAAAGHYDLAIQAFEQYLVDGKDDVGVERRDEVLQEITKLRPLVGFVDLKVPKGLVVRVDGRERGKTPLKGKLMITVGHTHKVELLRGEEVAFAKEIKVFGGMVETVTFAEEAAAPAEEGPVEEVTEDEEEVEEEMTGVELGGWILVGTGAAALVAGAVCGGLALSQSSRLEEYCPDGQCAPAREGEVEALGSLALSSDILLAVGAAAAVAGLVMVLVPSGGEEEMVDEPVTATVVPGGVVLGGRF